MILLYADTLIFELKTVTFDGADSAQTAMETTISIEGWHSKPAGNIRTPYFTVGPPPAPISKSAPCSTALYQSIQTK